MAESKPTPGLAVSKKLDIRQWVHTLPLQGERVLVRLFTNRDLSENYISWLNDPEVVRYSNQRFLTHDMDSVSRYFKSFIGSSNIFLTIEDAQNAQQVGTMTVYVQPYHHTSDVGILVGERGKGYGAEAWCLVVDWLLNICQVRKITAGTLACNHGMLRLMEKSGMEREAVRRNQEIVEGKPQDIIYFAKFHAI